MTVGLLLAAVAVWLSGRRTERRGEPAGRSGAGPSRRARGGLARRVHGGDRASRRPAGPRSRNLAPVAAAALVVAGWTLFAVPGLALGTALAGPAVAFVRAAQRRSAASHDVEQLPLLLDLVAAALRSGQPPAAALDLGCAAVGAAGAGIDAAGVAAGVADVRRVAALLRLGADPAQAWAGVGAGPLAPVARAAVRSADSGTRLARSFETLAEELRVERRARAEARAQRVAVLAMAPLGLCFLPAFVCIGVAPVIVGIARGVFATLP